MAGKGAELAWKAVGTGSAVLAAIAFRKVATSTWKLAWGGDPPTNPADPETSVSEAVAWSLLVGAGVGLVRMLAARKAANYWRKSTGALPPGLQDVSA